MHVRNRARALQELVTSSMDEAISWLIMSLSLNYYDCPSWAPATQDLVVWLRRPPAALQQQYVLRVSVEKLDL